MRNASCYTQLSMIAFSMSIIYGENKEDIEKNNRLQPINEIGNELRDINLFLIASRTFPYIPINEHSLFTTRPFKINIFLRMHTFL